MISVLAVDPRGPVELDPPPAIEVLWAHSAEEALEKLARNRRIDAVLYFDEALAKETTALLGAEGTCVPALFGVGAAVDGVIPLDRLRLFEDLRERLGE